MASINTSTNTICQQVGCYQYITHVCASPVHVNDRTCRDHDTMRFAYTTQQLNQKKTTYIPFRFLLKEFEFE